MLDRDQLKALIDRIVAGTASADDRRALGQLYQDRQLLVVASGTGSVAAGDILNSVVITGQGNIVLNGGDDRLLEQALRQVLGEFTGTASRLTSDTTPPRLRVFFSYDPADPTARGVVEQVRLRLPPAGWEIIEGTDVAAKGWHRDLYTLLGRCHAAVILLSESVLQAEDSGALTQHPVYQAMSLSTVRPLVETQFPFALVPLLLDPVTPQRVAAYPRLSRLLQEAPPPLDRPENPGQAITDRLMPLTTITPVPKTRLEVLTQIVRDAFDGVAVADSDLYQALLTGETWEPELQPDPCSQLAWCLWQANYKTVGKMIRALRPKFKPPQDQNLATLVDLIAPAWVDPWEARWVPLAASRTPQRGAIVIPARRATKPRFVGFSFVRRAYCLPLDSRWKVVEVTAVTGEGGLAELIGEIQGALDDNVLQVGRGELTEDDRDKLLQMYVDDKDNGGPIFVALLLPDLRFVPPLMDAFPTITFVVLNPVAPAEDQIHQLGDRIFLQPDLGQEAVMANMIYENLKLEIKPRPA